MVNILLEGYDINAPYLRRELERYIKPGHRVAVIALSFRDSRVKSAEDWDRLYSKNGRFYGGITGGFAAYGIPEENISFINYFTDTSASAREKIESADIIYFLGGLPDRMTERIKEMGLFDTLRAFDGIVMGYSAGAVIQLSEYHLLPDSDYPEFAYYNGLGYLDNFYLEVHYESSRAQRASIDRVLSERRKTVYATKLDSGAIVVDGSIKTLGEVEVFTPPLPSAYAKPACPNA